MWSGVIGPVRCAVRVCAVRDIGLLLRLLVRFVGLKMAVQMSANHQIEELGKLAIFHRAVAGEVDQRPLAHLERDGFCALAVVDHAALSATPVIRTLASACIGAYPGDLMTPYAYFCRVELPMFAALAMAGHWSRGVANSCRLTYV